MDSAYRRSIDPDRRGDWLAPTNQLIVQLIQSVDLLAYMWADEKTRGNPPEPLAMPWEAAEAVAAQQAHDVALVAQLRANAAAST